MKLQLKARRKAFAHLTAMGYGRSVMRQVMFAFKSITLHNDKPLSPQEVWYMMYEMARSYQQQQEEYNQLHDCIVGDLMTRLIKARAMY